LSHLEESVVIGNVVSVAGSGIVGVGVDISVNGTTVLLPEAESIGRPATLATQVVGIAGDQVLLGSLEEGTVVNSVFGLNGTS